MNPTIELIFTISGAALVLLSVYGAATRNRRLFLSGFCFYSILPIIGESLRYNTDQGSVHVILIFLSLVQLVLQIPDKNVYGRDNVPATKIATKVGLAVLIINAGAAIAVFCLNLGIPMQFGYYHVAFVLIMVYIMIIRFTSNVSWKE